MQDREIAYEQNVSRLEVAWADRIAEYARAAVSKLLSNEYSDYAENPDPENLRMDAGTVVEARLFRSSHWAGVKATTISDIAYEAVGKEITKRYFDQG